MRQEYGIDNAKNIAGFLGRSLTAGIHIDSNSDGEISRMEKFGLAQNVGFDAFNTFINLNYEAIGKEFGDLKANEITELIMEYSENQSLKDPVLEGIIEDALLWLSQGANFIERIKDWKALKAQTVEFKNIGEIAPNLLPVKFRKAA